MRDEYITVYVQKTPAVRYDHLYRTLYITIYKLVAGQRSLAYITNWRSIFWLS